MHHIHVSVLINKHFYTLNLNLKVKIIIHTKYRINQSVINKQMNHPSEQLNESLRQSKSHSKRKRGIKVSLTPSKRQNSLNQVPCDNSFDIISENNTRKVVELPTIQSRMATFAHATKSNIPRVNFHYSTPSEVNSSQVGVQGKNKEFGVQLVQSNHLITTNNLPVSRTRYDNRQNAQSSNEVLPKFNNINNQQQNKEKQVMKITSQINREEFWTLNHSQQQVAAQKIQIRPQVYKIVSDIKEKTKKHSDTKNKKEEQKVTQFKEEKEIIQSTKINPKQNKIDKSKIEKQIKDNNRVENQSQPKQIKRSQIKNIQKQALQNQNIEKCSDTFMAQNKNITNTEIKNKNRQQKLKLAESKLLDIIRLCDEQ